MVKVLREHAPHPNPGPRSKEKPCAKIKLHVYPRGNLSSALPLCETVTFPGPEGPTPAASTYLPSPFLIIYSKATHWLLAS